MTALSTPDTRHFRDPWVWTIAAIVAVLHLATAARYDFFRNELYFIICGRHPAFGYADQPPIVPLLAAATQIFGENLFLLRLPAAIAATALIPVTASLALLLSGSRIAAILAAIAVAVSPGLTALTSTLGTSTFEPLCWTLCAYFLLTALKFQNPRPLLWFGLTAGLAFATKYGVAIWIVGLLAGALVTPARRILLSRDAVIAAGIAILLGAPSLIWQALHGFPFQQIVAFHSQEGKIFTGSFIRFIIIQAFAVNILLAPLWITGLIAPFTSPRLALGRVTAIAFIITTAAIFAAHGKDYYLFPAYPAIIATGAAAIIALNRWLRGTWFTLATANALFVLPLTLPILSPDGLSRYLAKTHIHIAPNERAAIGAPITQVFSDEFGWRQLAAAVTATYATLPASDRAATGIFAWNYGEASAIDFFISPALLPRAMSAEDQFYLWGPDANAPRNLILVNVDRAVWLPYCTWLEQAATFGTPFAMPYENNRPIYFCRGLSKPLADIWSQLKWAR
jgi:4-amino-4-deoxy-L-arabinose transferase-like glycosyltransferase